MSGKLLYSVIASLDGYVADEDGNFDWAAPDDELHAFVNDLERPVGTYLYGRRMYEVMVYWETAPADLPEVELDYARVWQGADKIVYSKTLRDVSSRRTAIEHEFDPARVAALKSSATSDLSVGGPDLAAQALAAGLVDEVGLFLTRWSSVVGTRRCLRAGGRTSSYWTTTGSATASCTSGTTSLSSTCRML